MSDAGVQVFPCCQCTAVRQRARYNFKGITTALSNYPACLRFPETPVTVQQVLLHLVGFAPTHLPFQALLLTLFKLLTHSWGFLPAVSTPLRIVDAGRIELRSVECYSLLLLRTVVGYPLLIQASAYRLSASLCPPKRANYIIKRRYR